MNLHRRPGRLVVAAATLQLAAGCGTETADRGARASESATPTGTASPSPTSSGTPAASPLTTAGLETGPAPKIGYAVNGMLVLPDGGGFELPKDTFDLARLGELTVVMQPGLSDGQPVSVLDADGKVLKTDAAVGGGLAVNADSDVVAWMGMNDEPRVLDRGGDRIVSMPEVPAGRSVVDVAGRVDCQEGGAGDVSGCTVLVNADSGQHQAWVSTSHGFSDWAGPLVRAIAFLPGDTGGILGFTEITDDGSCGGLWDSGAKPVWKTCDWGIVAPALDGRTILAGSAYADGLGDGALAFLDVDGAIVHAWSGGGGTVVSRQWEDAQHVLAVVFEDGAWSIVRFGVDGSLEYAVPPQSGSDLDNPFLLQTT